MAEYGFFHPERGYWQAIDGDLDKLLSGYPEGTISVPLKPGSDYEWLKGDWVHIPTPTPIPDRVTARQFKLQLLAIGLLAPVEAWVASQSLAVQIAYANSGTFVRDEPMMRAGFEALKLSAAQVDEFFVAAAQI